MSLPWIKLHRKIQHSPMYKALNSKQRDVLIQLLLMANTEENEWSWNGEMYQCKPGQFITSLESIKANCSKDISIQNIKTALKKFKTWRFLTNESTNSGRKITIINWECYQGTQEKLTDKSNVDQQRSNRDLTPIGDIRYKNKEKNTAFGNAESPPDCLLSRKKRELTGRRLETFNRFWDAFDYKKGRAEAVDAWIDIPQLTESLVTQICQAAKREAEARPALIAEKRTPKMAQGWITGRRWEDEISNQQPKIVSVEF